MTLRPDWYDAPAFLAVARTGTLTGAAKLLGMGIATASRRIERLEKALGVPLFSRHQNGYRLTDEGEALLPKAEALEYAMQAFHAKARAEAEAVGHVRLATAQNLANPIIIPGLAPLLAQHPGLSIEVATNVTTVNLHKRDADLAIRMVRPTHGNLSVRRIGTLGFGLYGSDAYMAAREKPHGARQLENDSFIGWSDRFSELSVAKWLARAMRGKFPVLTTTNLSAQLSAAVSGVGLAVLPHFLAQEAGLKRAPFEMDLNQPIWLVLHRDLSTSTRVRIVADHLVEIIKRNSDRLRGELKM